MSDAAADHPILFLPGPTEVDAELRQIMAMPLIGHRDPRFVATAQDVCARLRHLFCTTQHAAFETCTGTALMEAAIRNLVPLQGRTLHLVGGAFGVRFVEVARGCGRRPEVLEVPLGQAHDPAALDAHLAAMAAAGEVPDAVCITHNETSTGVLQPLAALAAVVRRHAPGAQLLVDVVTSVAGAELRFDDWDLDFAFAGTQKCLALPPGLGVYAVSDRALRRAADVEHRGFLLDLCAAVPETVAGKPIATPCVPLVFALHRQLERIADEGLAARHARHLSLRDRTLQWSAERGMAPFVAEPAARSPTVSCLDARGQDVAAMAKRAQAAGFRLDQGYGELKGKAFRIGHMGDHDLPRLERLLAAL